jgi:hypothetical protein
MGGASAGGMCSAMAVLHALKKERKPIKDAKKIGEKRDNIFYDSWVLLDDKDVNAEDPKPSFSKLWDTDDLENDQKVTALFNSKSIDAIASRAYNGSAENPYNHAFLPPYIAPDMELLLSLTNVRGIPLDVDFSTPLAQLGRRPDKPIHSTWEHYFLAHFKLSGGRLPNFEYLWFNPNEPQCREVMQLSTIATGAFPIGLKFRYFNQSHFPREYIQKEISRIVLRDFKPSSNANEELRNELRLQIAAWVPRDPSAFAQLLTLVEKLPAKSFDFADLVGRNTKLSSEEKKSMLEAIDRFQTEIDFSSMPTNYEFADIDGGVINNEPYGEVVEVLKARVQSNSLDQHMNFGVIMIDPFPDRSDRQETYKKPESLMDIVPNIIRTLKNQSRVKRHEMLEANFSKYMRGVIFPRKKIAEGNYDSEPLCSASFEAFGGFLDIKFRHHDFFLGRNNARNFYRFFWTLEYNPKKGIVHPIHENWPEKAKEAFLIEWPVGSGRKYLPIVPDLNVLLEKQRNVHDGYKHYDIKEKPKIKPDFLFELEPKIAQRIATIAKFAINDFNTEKKQKQIAAANQTPLADVWIEAHNEEKKKKSLTLFLLKSSIGGRLQNFILKKLSKPAANWVVNWIVKDLERKNLLEKK